MANARVPWGVIGVGLLASTAIILNKIALEKKMEFVDLERERLNKVHRGAKITIICNPDKYSAGVYTIGKGRDSLDIWFSESPVSRTVDCLQQHFMYAIENQLVEGSPSYLKFKKHYIPTFLKNVHSLLLARKLDKDQLEEIIKPLLKLQVSFIFDEQRVLLANEDHPLVKELLKLGAGRAVVLDGESPESLYKNIFTQDGEGNEIPIERSRFMMLFLAGHSYTDHQLQQAANHLVDKLVLKFNLAPRNNDPVPSLISRTTPGPISM